jgi:mycobactin lysine-N-oxygenase
MHHLSKKKLNFIISKVEIKMNNLIVIGAGPKGLAIAAKNQVLQSLGIETPNVIIIEKSEIAANWTGKSGYTNGKMTLGTSPEKDIGYPYDTQEFSPKTNEKVNQGMMHFSWMSYLINTNQYSDYIDRGRPFPVHHEYAAYLLWVADQLESSTVFKFGMVKSLDLINEKTVEVTYKTKHGDVSVLGGGIVFTGPGKSKVEYSKKNSKRVLDIEKFWITYKETDFKPGDKIGIVGAGENAASMAIALGDLDVSLNIDVITPAGAIFSRGESFFENQVYSDPVKGNWDKLTHADKINFIKRTDLGVFGVYAQGQLNNRRDIQVVPGRVQEITEGETSVDVKLAYDQSTETQKFDYIILASGFDQLKMLRDIASTKLLESVESSLGLGTLNQENLEQKILSDMSLAGLEFKLHLPMISRIKQGPGFANLSCLGKLSDKILSGYLVEQNINLINNQNELPILKEASLC